jgi:hypothetical protein
METSNAKEGEDRTFAKVSGLDFWPWSYGWCLIFFCVQVLGDFIKSHSSLRSLVANNYYFSEEDQVYFAEALAQSKSLWVRWFLTVPTVYILLRLDFSPC